MADKKVESIQLQSLNSLEERVEKVKLLFPEVVNEDGIDFDTLANLLGKHEARRERYNFTWAGKQDAILSLHNRSRGTLKPVPEESVNWEDTKNIFIEGDNLLVLKLLYKSYFGRVKMIYIDPPYNTGNDFVYPDDYSDPLNHYLRMTGQVDDEGNLQTSDPDKSGRKHSGWLSMMYPRLFLARQLLRDDGVIFISIDDNEVHNLRLLMNQVFGEENFIAQIVWHSKYTQANDAKYLSRQHEYLLFYAKHKLSISKLRIKRPDSMNRSYSNPDNDPRGPWKPTPLHAKSGSKNYKHIFSNGYEWEAPKGRYPRYSQKKLIELEQDNRISFGEDGNSTPNTKTFLGELDEGVVSGSMWSFREVGHTHGANEEVSSLLGKGAFDNPKSVGLIARCCDLATETSSDDIILDFFSGSGTTAHAVLEQNREDGGNRRFIMVQMAEKIDGDKNKNEAAYNFCIDNNLRPTIAEISKERIRRVIDRMGSEKQGRLDGLETHPSADLGFRVFQLTLPPIRHWPDMSTGDTLPQEYEKQLELSLSDPLLDGWTVPDVIADIAIKEEGFSLTYRVEQVVADPGETVSTVYKITDDDKEQHFYACLDDKISFDEIKALNLSRDDVFVFRDSAADDTIIANLALTCRIKTI
ncbi:MAG: site-specific DNA-methyltransferase [Chloroflexi bacterium]|nr:site-specific DNA-methyltransferase [Chloroflexota bacterium]